MRLEDEKRQQIVKRLILQWHPRKHLEDKEFYSEAFEYIKNELGGSYDKYIDAWVKCAIEHEAQRGKYIEKVTISDVPWPLPIPLRLCIRNPQPQEAKRWFRQAEADLAAGANEIDSSEPFYEWACFKCHQVKLIIDLCNLLTVNIFVLFCFIFVLFLFYFVFI